MRQGFVPQYASPLFTSLTVVLDGCEPASLCPRVKISEPCNSARPLKAGIDSDVSGYRARRRSWNLQTDGNLRWSSEAAFAPVPGGRLQWQLCGVRHKQCFMPQAFNPRQTVQRSLHSTPAEAVDRAARDGFSQAPLWPAPARVPNSCFVAVRESTQGSSHRQQSLHSRHSQTNAERSQRAQSTLESHRRMAVTASRLGALRRCLEATPALAFEILDADGLWGWA